VASRLRTIYIWVAVALLLAGIGVRVAFCFPAHIFPADSDAVLAGLCALGVVNGQLPLFFPSGYRLSSQSCYVTAAMFSLFGPTRSALSATSVFFGSLFLIFGWLALLELTGPEAAIPGLLLMAFPPFQFWLVTYPTWAYTEIMASSALTLWLGFRLLRPQMANRLLVAFLFGISVGFSYWTSPQTVMISAPLIAMLLWTRRPSWRPLAVGGLGCILALLPYTVVLARQGFSPFLSSFATRPVSGLTQFIHNTRYLLGYTFPVLFLSHTTHEISILSVSGARLALIALGIGFLTIMAIRRREDGRDTTGLEFSVLLLPAGIILFGCAVYVASGAGSVRGWTVRYLAPLILAVPVCSSILHREVQTRRGRAIVLAGAIALASLQTMEYPIFSRQARKQQVAELADNSALVSWIKKNNRDLVIGDYWMVYHLNFDTLRSVIALPVEPSFDYFGYGHDLRGRQARAALVDNNCYRLQAWTERLGLPGHMERVGSGFVGFVIEDPLDANGIERARLSGEMTNSR